MGELVLYGLLAIIIAGGLFLLATRFLPAGEQIAPPLRDEPPWELPPDRVLRPEDVDSVRLPVALRGYRFAETDVLLDRLAGELRARDAEIVRLRGTTGGAAPRRESLAPMRFDKPVASKSPVSEQTDVQPDRKPDDPPAAALDEPTRKRSWAPGGAAPGGSARAESSPPPFADDDERG